MTPEARLVFVLFFFAVWFFLGLITWAVAAVIARGRGALPALPLALAGAGVAGVAVPLAGLDNVGGFFLSLGAALLAGAIASAGAMILSNRANRSMKKPPTSARTRGQSGEESAPSRLNPLRIFYVARVAYRATSSVPRTMRIPRHADPDIALTHVENLLGSQEVSWDGLDTKIAALFGFSATVLSVLGAFLALRADTLSTHEMDTGLDTWMLLLLLGNVGLFLLIAALAFIAWHTRPFKNVLWQDLLTAMQSKDGVRVKWSMFLGQAKAYDLNDAVIRFKAVAVDYLIVLFALQVLSLVAAILFSSA